MAQFFLGTANAANPTGSIIPMMFDQPPASESTDVSFFTALTQPATQLQDDDASTVSESQNPYDNLWGRFVPCNPSVPAIDFKDSQPTYTIGRNQNNHIVVAAAKISGKHCEIQLINESDDTKTVNVVDFSSNGTYVNGCKIGKGRHLRLTHGDEVSLGIPTTGENDDFRFMFRKSSAPIEAGNGFHAQYQLGDTLGKGSFATVRKAFSRSNGLAVAVKVIAKHRFAHNVKSRQMFERELAILQNLRHHNITRLIEYFEDESTIYIVMELVSGGDLLDYIINNGPVPEPQAKIWTAQIVDALGYVHNKQITHRDLKPENILLSSDEPKIIKLADFGLAKSVDQDTFLKTMCGTPSYLAPEVVLRTDGDPYDSKVDCWSLGVIIYSMMTNTACFNEDEKIPLTERIAERSVEWTNLLNMGITDECYDFIFRLIVNDPRQRMSIQQAKEHPWIQHISNPPPPGFEGSQEQQQSHDDDEANEYDYARNLAARAFTEPGSGVNSGNASFSFAQVPGGLDSSRWGHYQTSGRSAFSSGSSLQQLDPTSFTATTPVGDTPSPKDLDQCSQGFRNLNLRVDPTGMAVDQAPADPSAMDASPTSTKHPADAVDGSWQVVADGRPIKPVPRTSAGTNSGEHLVVPPANSDRSRTPTPGSRGAAKAPHQMPAPSATKRKAGDVDGESSELSSPPPADDEYEGQSDVPRARGSGSRKKQAKTTNTTKAQAQPKVTASTGRTSLRVRERAAVGLATPNGTTRSTGKTPAKRRPANKIKMPTSSDDEDEDVAMNSPNKPRPSTSTTATRRTSRRSATSSKTPRYS